ncbi:MAG TPA: GNAT family N-acetyltransferase [Thermoplasmata archaeon]|nr:GNAT family N-acetyltransferase [Thermoplasmata archaeon]
MTPTPRTVPITSAPAEALRILGELGEELALAGGVEAKAAVEPLVTGVRAGELPGILWVGPQDEAVGIAWWEPPSEAGRRAGLFLSGGYRTEAALRGLLEATETAPGGPLLEVSDQIAGVPPLLRARVLSAGGFREVSRIDLAWPPGRPVEPAPPPSRGTARPLRREDEPALSVLLDRAYSDNPIDLALFRQRRDRRADSVDAIHLLLAGELGPWVPSASYGVEENGRLLAATIVNDYRGALITEVMVDPDARRQGLARCLLLHSLQGLRALGREDIRLVVTLTNDPAYRLYSSMGFTPLPATQGSTWLHVARLGLAPQAA